MRLQQALDKARKDQEQASLPEWESHKARLNRSHKQARWKAPVYDISVTRPIDPEFLKANRCICIEPESPEVECYKFLRASIQHHVQKNNWRTVLITSPTPGDGKTITAANLALTIAKTYNQTVLLTDCDLKRQSIHKLLGLSSLVGLQDYLIQDTPLEKIIVWPGIEKLSVISGGNPVTNSSEVLGSPQMKALVGELKSRYEDRIILFDSPPVLSGADTLALAPFMDCIVLVVTEGKTSLKDVRKTIEMLPSKKVIGFVMNQQKTDSFRSYYYG